MALLQDTDLERDELLRQLEQAQKKPGAEQGGITGGGSLDAGLAPAPTDPLAAAAPAQTYGMRGFEQSKLDRPVEEQSEKYKMGNIFKKYDPKGGVTPEMIAELNGLGIAEFSGEGDKLTVNNTKNDPRFGRGGTSDVVYGMKGQNADTAWQPWFIDEGGGDPAAGFPQTSRSDASPSSFETISQLAPTDTGFLKKLQDQIAEALGGYSNLDRSALLNLIGGK